MSKPLIFVLQVIGAVLILFNIPALYEGRGIFPVFIGAVLFIVAGVAWRRRIKYSRHGGSK